MALRMASLIFFGQWHDLTLGQWNPEISEFEFEFANSVAPPNWGEGARERGGKMENWGGGSVTGIEVSVNHGLWQFCFSAGVALGLWSRFWCPCR